MTHGHDDSNGFITLWPTLLLRRSLPGHEQANRELEQLILAKERSHRELTTDYRSDNLLAAQHSAASWLRECVNITVQDYFGQLGMDYSIQWSVHGWANVNRLGDYHDSHNHPHAYLSGTYYVRVPRQNAAGPRRKDARPGCITLYDPRGAVNMTAIKGDPYIEPEHTIEPHAGLILLWPAFLYHFVHPNLSREPRISVSFNVMLKWSDTYLPAQA